MSERCPNCRALNTRVRHEYELHGWVQPDDYCGVCGKNWPRPSTDPPRKESRVHAFVAKNESPS